MFFRFVVTDNTSINNPGFFFFKHCTEPRTTEKGDSRGPMAINENWWEKWGNDLKWIVVPRQQELVPMKSSQCGSFAVSQALDKDYMHSPRRPVSLSPAFEGIRGRLSRWEDCRRVLARLAGLTGEGRGRSRGLSAAEPALAPGSWGTLSPMSGGVRSSLLKDSWECRLLPPHP